MAWFRCTTPYATYQTDLLTHNKQMFLSRPFWDLATMQLSNLVG
jgi:hypothetical protein